MVFKISPHEFSDVLDFHVCLLFRACVNFVLSFLFFFQSSNIVSVFGLHGINEFFLGDKLSFDLFSVFDLVCDSGL